MPWVFSISLILKLGLYQTLLAHNVDAQSRYIEVFFDWQEDHWLQHYYSAYCRCMFDHSEELRFPCSYPVDIHPILSLFWVSLIIWILLCLNCLHFGQTWFLQLIPSHQTYLLSHFYQASQICCFLLHQIWYQFHFHFDWFEQVVFFSFLGWM